MIPHLPANSRPQRPQPPVAASHDLQSQLEDLLNTIWAAEENWRFDDRLDMALKLRPQAA